MPPIPLYQQQATPQGLVNVEPSRAGSATGRVVEQVGGQVGAIGQQIASVMGQQNAAAENAQMQIEAERRAQQAEEARLLASAAAARAEGEIRQKREAWELERVTENGSLAINDMAPYNTFEENAEASNKELLASADKFNPMVSRYLAPALQHIANAEGEKLRTFQKRRRDDYVVGMVSSGIDADAKTLSVSEDPSRDFQRLAGSWDAQLKSREIEGLGFDNRLPWEARDQMAEAARRKLSIAAEQRSLDLSGPEGYLRARGRDADGNAISSSTSRRVKAGSESVAGGKWDAQIASAAAKYGIDPALVEAVMHQESRGNEKARSAKGARGLMQLMPQTAVGLGVDPEDPAQNIDGGARYLRQMLDQFGGDEEKALAAYNAGPNAVQKHGGIPPYKETQGYVSSIKARMQSRSEATPGPAASGDLPPSWKALNPDEQQRWLDVATRAAQQERGAKRAELAEELRIRERNESNGEIVGAPLTFADYQAVYDDPEKARLRWEEHQPMQQVAQDMTRLKSLPAQERQALVTGAAPNPSDPHFDAKQRAWDLLRQANDRVDQQVKKDPFGYVMSTNREAQKAGEAWNAATLSKDPAQIAKARTRFVAVVEDAQRSQGVDVPRLTTPEQEASIVSSLTDPKATGEVVADRVRAESSKWGDAWPTVYRRISKDLPSDVDVLASGDLSEPAAALVGTLSRTPTKQLQDGLDKGDVREVRPSVTLALQPFYQAMSGVNPAAAFEKRERYADVAEKLAYHALQRGIARSPSAAADWASSQLLSRYEFKSSRNAAVSRDPATGSEVRSASTWMVPKETNPAAVDLGSQRVLQFAPMLLGEVQAPPDYEGAPGAYVADVRRLGYWRNAGASEDGLVLMVAGAPVLRKDGSEFRLGWDELGRLGGSQFWSDPRMKQQKAALDAAMQGKSRGSLPFFVD